MNDQTEGSPPGALDLSQAAIGELHTPLRVLVTNALREAIFSGRYSPGDRLVEDQLAATFRVSRNPVRDALRALESEGLVVVTPRRGATVAGFSPGEAQELIEVRAALEGLNARLAARRKDPDMIRALQEALELGRATAPTGDTAELLRLNDLFHDRLAAAGRNRILAETIRSLRDRTNLVFAPRNVERAAQNWEEHAGILQAVIAGDEELAALLASRHVLQAGQFYLNARTR